MANAVTFTVVVAGSLETFDCSRSNAAIAARLGVRVSAIRARCTSGSITQQFDIQVPEDMLVRVLSSALPPQPSQGACAVPILSHPHLSSLSSLARPGVRRGCDHQQ